MCTIKKRIAVLMGGISLEHEVSLLSGQGVIDALLVSGYEPIAICLQKDGLWRFSDDAPITVQEAISQLAQIDPACIFIALHGPNGEDGRIQGLFDCLGFPYTGSGCAASALSMDKIRAKAIVNDFKVKTAHHLVISHEEWLCDYKSVVNRVEEETGLPAVIKAPSQGSSFGMAIPHNNHDFIRNMNEIIGLENVVMVEQYIEGIEVTCSILDISTQDKPQALPVTEIRPATSPYFDYFAKYTPGASQEITPASIGEHLTCTVQQAAIAAHTALGCSGWSRSDFIINDDGPVWLEVNTVPGLTKTSLFPQAANAAGISYDKLITLLIEDAILRVLEQKK